MAIFLNGKASGLVVIGKKGGFGLFVAALVAWHVAQPLSYSWTKIPIFGHQKSLAIMTQVLSVPGCPAVVESWYSDVTPLLKALSSTTMRRSPFVTARRAVRTAMVFRVEVATRLWSRRSRAKSFGADLEGNQSNHSKFVARSRIANEVKLRA